MVWVAVTLWSVPDLSTAHGKLAWGGLVCWWLIRYSLPNLRVRHLGKQHKVIARVLDNSALTDFTIPDMVGLGLKVLVPITEYRGNIYRNFLAMGQVPDIFEDCIHRADVGKLDRYCVILFIT